MPRTVITTTLTVLVVALVGCKKSPPALSSVVLPLPQVPEGLEQGDCYPAKNGMMCTVFNRQYHGDPKQEKHASTEAARAAKNAGWLYMPYCTILPKPLVCPSHLVVGYWYRMSPGSKETGPRFGPPYPQNPSLSPPYFSEPIDYIFTPGVMSVCRSEDPGFCGYFLPTIPTIGDPKLSLKQARQNLQSALAGSGWSFEAECSSDFEAKGYGKCVGVAKFEYQVQLTLPKPAPSPEAVPPTRKSRNASDLLETAMTACLDRWEVEINGQPEVGRDLGELCDIVCSTTEFSQVPLLSGSQYETVGEWCIGKGLP